MPRQFRTYIIALSLFSGAINLLMLTGPLFMLQVYDRVLASGSVPTLVGLFGLVVALFAFLGILEVIRSKMLVRISGRIDEVAAVRFAGAKRTGRGSGGQDISRPQGDQQEPRAGSVD